MNKLLNSVFGNWHTTLTGTLEGVILSIITNHAVKGLSWHDALVTGALALPVLRGILSKDAAVGSKGVE